jgi:glucose/arabinose dehydrogenase
MHSRLRALSGLLVFALLVAAVPLAAPVAVNGVATVPSGFTDTEFATGFGGRLTTMTFAPDGRLFVSEKQGSVRIVKNGSLLAQPFLTVATDTNSENGLKGIAFDPGFATNRFVYVYYTDAATLRNRVSRFTASASNPDVADAASEQVILDGISTGTYRTGGALHFGGDGKLYVSTGDASYAPNGQQLANLNGKILRLNPDGSIPADNPFVGQSGRRAEIWAYGFRNPFTFAFQEGSGRMFINDVGQDTWEELNDGARGANYGWPTCEGVCGNPAFVDPIYSYNHNDQPGQSITGAVFYDGSMFPSDYSGDYFFGDYVGGFIKRYDLVTRQVADFATNALYPVDLDVGPDGALYYLSVETHKVHRIAYGETPPPPPPPPADGNRFLNPGFEAASLAPWRANVRTPARATITRDTSEHASGAASLRVDVTAATSTSNDWYAQVAQPSIALSAGKTHTLSFAARASSNRTIRVALQQSVAPNAIYFQRSTPITTAWQTYTMTFTPTVTDPQALFNVNLASQVGQIWIDDVSLKSTTGQPPVPVIAAPAAGATYRAGDTINFAGSATDPEQGSLGAAALTWEVVFHHDTHTHPFVEPFSGATGGSFSPPDTGESSAEVWYRIHLTATDADGNTSEVTRDVVPVTSVLTVTTQPVGLSVNLDGAPVTGPITLSGVVNFKRELSAPATQTVGGVSYQFVSWSDGGAATHTIATPAANTTYTATYQPTGGTNLLQNSGFEGTGSGWLAPWLANVRSPAAAKATRDTVNPALGNASLQVNVTASGLDWYAQVLQPNVSLTAGAPHTLTFRARASSARTIRLAFQRNSAPHPVYFQQSVSLTTTWQPYTITFTPTVTDPKTLFNFNVGANTGSVWLDEISLSR